MRVVLNDTILRRKRKIIEDELYYRIDPIDDSGFVVTIPGNQTGDVSVRWNGVTYKKYDTGSTCGESFVECTTTYNIQNENTSTNNITYETYANYPSDNPVVTQKITFIHQGSSLSRYDASINNVRARNGELILSSGENIRNFTERPSAFTIIYDILYKPVYSTGEGGSDWSTDDWQVYLKDVEKNVSARVRAYNGGLGTSYELIIGENLYSGVESLNVASIQSNTTEGYTVYTVPASTSSLIPIEATISVLNYDSRVQYDLPRFTIKEPTQSGGGNTPDPSTGS
jgi:hypothetical protein